MLLASPHSVNTSPNSHTSSLERVQARIETVAGQIVPLRYRLRRNHNDGEAKLLHQLEQELLRLVAHRARLFAGRDAG